MKRFFVAICSIAFVIGLSVFASSSRASTGIEPVYPIQTGNLNVRFVYEQYQVFLEEVAHSITSGAPATLSHDADRWLSYISALRAYTTYWQGKLFLDWPVTHGKNYELGSPLEPTCTFKSNQAACDLATLVINARDELVVSATAKDLPMHFLPQDLARQQSYWTSMEDFINEFMLVVQPLDEPVTAAEEALGLEPGFKAEGGE